MAFGMEHYFHHKYHSHAEAAHDHKEDVKVDMAKVDAALPAAAAAAMAEADGKPLPADMDALTAEIKSLRSEIGTLRAGMRLIIRANLSYPPSPVSAAPSELDSRHHGSLPPRFHPDREPGPAQARHGASPAPNPRAKSPR